MYVVVDSRSLELWLILFPSQVLLAIMTGAFGLAGWYFGKLFVDSISQALY